MTAKDILTKIRLILEGDLSDEKKVETIALWAKPSKHIIEIPRTRLIKEELLQYQIPMITYKKIEDQVLPFLETVNKMKGTKYVVYYYHYFPFWIFFKGKGYEDLTTARHISKLAAKKWPTEKKMPNVKGTIRTFNKLHKQFNEMNQKK